MCRAARILGKSPTPSTSRLDKIRGSEYGRRLPSSLQMKCHCSIEPRESAKTIAALKPFRTARLLKTVKRVALTRMHMASSDISRPGMSAGLLGTGNPSATVGFLKSCFQQLLSRTWGCRRLGSVAVPSSPIVSPAMLLARESLSGSSSTNSRVRRGISCSCSESPADWN